MDFINIIFDKIVSETSSFIVERNESDGWNYLLINGHEDSIYVNQEPWILFNLFENEIAENLSLPLDITKRKSYINKTVESLKSIDEKIVQIKSFWQSKDITYKDCSKNSFNLDEFERLSKYFLEIKHELRRIINRLSSELINLANNKGPFSNFELEWTRDKTDLIELAKALSLCNAIRKSGEALNYADTYELFGSIFNMELKNPEDQLRHRAETQDTPNFLEELLKKFMEDQKILKHRRES